MAWSTRRSRRSARGLVYSSQRLQDPETAQAWYSINRGSSGSRKHTQVTIAPLQGAGSGDRESGTLQSGSHESQSALQPPSPACCRPSLAARAGLALVCVVAIAFWALKPLPLHSPLGANSEGKQTDTAEDFSDWYQNSSWFESYSVDPARQRMWRRQTTDQDRDAVCNDGTPGTFYVRPGQGQGARK